MTFLLKHISKLIWHSSNLKLTTQFVMHTYELEVNTRLCVQSGTDDRVSTSSVQKLMFLYFIWCNSARLYLLLRLPDYTKGYLIQPHWRRLFIPFIFGSQTHVQISEYSTLKYIIMILWCANVWFDNCNVTWTISNFIALFSKVAIWSMRCHSFYCSPPSAPIFWLTEKNAVSFPEFWIGEEL